MCTAFQRVLTQKSTKEKDQSLDRSDISDQTQKPRNQSGGKWKLRKRKQLHLLGTLYFCYGKIFLFLHTLISQKMLLHTRNFSGVASEAICIPLGPISKIVIFLQFEFSR